MDKYLGNGEEDGEKEKGLGESFLEDSKECVHSKSQFVVNEKFNTGVLWYSDWDFDLCLNGMKIFNKTMGSALRSKDECYWYFAWW